MKIINPLTFDRSAFSRASTATYYNSAGILVTAPVDVLRIGYNPTTLGYIGPIYENAVTNLVQSSNYFLNNVWDRGSPASQIEPDMAISPDGNFNASRLTNSASYVTQNIPDANRVAASIYIKPASPGQFPNASQATFQWILRFQGGGYFYVNYTFYSDHEPTITTGTNVYEPDASYTLQALPNGWYRATIYGGYRAISFPVTHIQFTSSNAFYIYGAMAEQITPPFTGPTSYVPSPGLTNGTRAADIFEGTPPVVLTSNVLENDAPIWNSGGSYVPGNRVMVLGEYHRVYEAIAGNTNKFPPDNLGTDWLDTGPTNRFKMFDMRTGAENQTVANDGNNISVSVGVLGRVNALVLLNIDADRVRILIRDANGNIVKEELRYLIGEPLQTGWYDWFLGARGEDDLVIYEDFSFVEGENGNIEVIAESDSGPAAIGKMIVGDIIEIGCTRFGSSGGIIDFSRKERDQFGNNTVVERRYIDKFDYDIQVDTSSLYDIKNLLASLRAKPAVYIGSENHLVTVVFGFYRDFNIVIQGPKKSSCTIQSEGI